MDKKQRAEAKAALKEKAKKELGVTEQDFKTLEEMMKIAKMPIKLKDKDVELGEGEVDIRELSQSSLNQMFFRLFCMNNLTLKSIDQSLTDVLRLFMIVIKHLGVTDIVKAIDDLEQDLKKVINKKTEA